MSTWLCKASSCSFVKMNVITIIACLLLFSINLYKVMEGWEELQARLSNCSNMYFFSINIWLNQETKGYGFTRALDRNSIARHFGFCLVCTELVISYGLWTFISIVAFDTANTCQENQKPNMKQWDQRSICFLVADKMSPPSHLSVWSADANLWNLWWCSWSLISVIFHVHFAGTFLG